MDNRKISRNSLKCPEKDKHGCAQLSHCLTHSLGEHQHGKNHQYTQTHSKPMSGLCQVSLHALFLPISLREWEDGPERPEQELPDGEVSPHQGTRLHLAARLGMAGRQHSPGAAPVRPEAPCHAVPGRAMPCRDMSRSAEPARAGPCRRSGAGQWPLSRRAHVAAGTEPDGGRGASEPPS